MSRWEPITRDGGIEEGLAARVHDPLWLLARQWQLGEFRGDDAASPARVDVVADTHALDGWRPAAAPDWRPYDPAGEPLERLVEQEPPDAAGDPRLRVEGGARLVRLLRAAGLADAPLAFAARHGFGPGAAGGLGGALLGRLADGAALAAPLGRLAAAATAPAEIAALGLDAGDQAALAGVATAWLGWWNARAGAGAAPAAPPELLPDAWDEHRLEYAFGARASTLGATELAAAEYLGGQLDWWSLDAVAPHAAPAAADAPETLEVGGVPAPARFGGMPAARFWEMEDAAFDPGSVDAAPHDLGRLLLVAFATVYGNDWLVVPVRLPIGTLLRVTSFRVTDVFGATHVLGPAGAGSPDWNLFALADTREASGASPWFLMAPRLPVLLDGPAVESVLLARDEMADLAWALEQQVPDAAGHPVSRYDAWLATRTPPAAPVVPRFRVETEVPDFWFPLAPEPLPDLEAVRLRLVPLTRLSEAGTPTAIMPLGALLAGATAATADPLWLHEEEVPREGATVTRAHQRARWHDGSVHAWMARRKSAGTGEAASGLRFDSVDEPGGA